MSGGRQIVRSALLWSHSQSSVSNKVMGTDAEGEDRERVIDRDAVSQYKHKVSLVSGFRIYLKSYNSVYLCFLFAISQAHFNTVNRSVSSCD